MINYFIKNKPNAQTLQAAAKGWSQLIERQDLGYIQLPDRDDNWATAAQFARQIKEKAKHLIVVGLGGSALGGKCLVESLGDSSRVLFLYNTDPKTVDAVLSNDNYLDHSHFLFISKSGGTLELACLIDILQSKLKLRKRKISDAISVITEEKPSALSDWANVNSLPVLAHPKDVGGRFSAFTPVGLVPAIFSGVSEAELRQGMQTALKQKDLVTQLSAFYVESFARGENISAFWSYVDQLASFTPWLVQLWAESLAKKVDRAGQAAKPVSTPVAYLGASDQHSVLQQLMEGSKDKSICFIRSAQHSLSGEILSGVGLPGFDYIKGKKLGEVFQVQSQATEEALNAEGRTTLSLQLEQVTPASLAELMFIFELLIGVVGEVLNINAFDQPGVELGKKITKEKLQKNSSL